MISFMILLSLLYDYMHGSCMMLFLVAFRCSFWLVILLSNLPGKKRKHEDIMANQS